MPRKWLSRHINNIGKLATPMGVLISLSAAIASMRNVDRAVSGISSRSTAVSSSLMNVATTILAGSVAVDDATTTGRISRMEWIERPGRISTSPAKTLRGMVSARIRDAPRPAPAGIRSERRP